MAHARNFSPSPEEAGLVVAAGGKVVSVESYELVAQSL